MGRMDRWIGTCKDRLDGWKKLRDLISSLWNTDSLDHMAFFLFIDSSSKLHTPSCIFFLISLSKQVPSSRLVYSLHSLSHRECQTFLLSLFNTAVSSADFFMMRFHQAFKPSPMVPTSSCDYFISFIIFFHFFCELRFL